MFHEEDVPGHQASPFVGHILIDPPLSPAERDYINRFANTRRVLREQGPYYAYAAPGPLADLSSDATVIDTNLPATGQPDLWCPWRITADGSRIVYPAHGMKSTKPAEWLAYLIDHFLRTQPRVMTDLSVEERDLLSIPSLNGHVCNGRIVCREHRNIVVEVNRVGQEKCYPSGEIEWLSSGVTDEPEPFDPLDCFLTPFPKGWRGGMIDRPMLHLSMVGPEVYAMAGRRQPSNERLVDAFIRRTDRIWFGRDIKDGTDRVPTKTKPGFSTLLSFGFRLGMPNGIAFLLENKTRIVTEIGYRKANALLVAVIAGQNQDSAGSGEAREFAEMLVPGIRINDITDDSDRKQGEVRLEVKHRGLEGESIVTHHMSHANLSNAIVSAAITAWGQVKS